MHILLHRAASSRLKWGTALISLLDLDHLAADALSYVASRVILLVSLACVLTRSWIVRPAESLAHGCESALSWTKCLHIWCPRATSVIRAANHLLSVVISWSRVVTLFEELTPLAKEGCCVCSSLLDVHWLTHLRIVSAWANIHMQLVVGSPIALNKAILSSVEELVVLLKAQRLLCEVSAPVKIV